MQGIKIQELKRVPVTAIGLARKISVSKKHQLKDWEVEAFSSIVETVGRKESTEEENEALYEGIIQLVRSRANKFKTPDVQDTEDLVSSCCSRIWETIHMYRSDKGWISTWIHYVCRSVLCCEYNDSMKHAKKIVLWSDFESDNWNEPASCDNYKNGKYEEDFMLRTRLMSAIKTLFDKNLDEKDILCAVFGNPFEENYSIPNGIPSMANIARTTNRNYNEIYSFFNRVVRPFFESSFSDYKK